MEPKRTPELELDAGTLARAQGAILGQLAGDALGSMVEFQSASTIARTYPDGPRDIAGSPLFGTIAGQPTDDSELALALARTLIARGFEPETIRAAYRAWLASGPFDRGHATVAGLTGHPLPDSQANGGLMRASPLGVFGWATPPERLAVWARAECALTHVHPVCRDASAVYVIAIAHAVRTGAGPREVWAAALEHARFHAFAPVVIDALEAAETAAPADFLTQQGWVRIALQNAFHRLLHAPSLEEGVAATVREGGDTDTNAAIAGALLGAVHGRDAVPERWRRVLLACRPHADTPLPRPEAYWPADALPLAERLLRAGAEAAR